MKSAQMSTGDTSNCQQEILRISIRSMTKLQTRPPIRGNFYQFSSEECKICVKRRCVCLCRSGDRGRLGIDTNART